MRLQDGHPQSTLSMLAKPGEAAQRFRELLSRENWAVLGVGLNDLQPLAEIYGEAWREQVLELVAKLLLSGREEWGTADDLLVHLTRETFLVITQASSAALWEERLRRTFSEDITSAFPPGHLDDRMVCLSSAQRLPMPSLAIGAVLDQDEPFSTPRDLLNKVVKARNRNERPALLYELNSVVVTINRLQEKKQVAKHNPAMLPLIEHFAKVTTDPIHDLRNGLSILYEEARKVSESLPDTAQGEALVVATRYSRFLLETFSEIRFRGVGSPHRVNLSELLTENRPLLVQRMDVKIVVDAPSESVEIYADRDQIAQMLFNLLDWLCSRKGGCESISVSCRGNMDQGEIVIMGDFDTDITGNDLLEYSLVALQTEQKPALYVFQKLAARYGGNIQFEPGRITLGFPKYQWQDVQSADALVAQVQHLRLQARELKACLDGILSNSDERTESFSVMDVMGLGSQVVADLVGEFGLICQKAETQGHAADESQAALWEPLEAASRSCLLLATRLLGKLRLPVLILDDDPRWLQMLLSHLPQTTYTLEPTTSLPDALQRLAATRHPVVVCDLQLVGFGKRGGLELLTKARTISEHTKVIIITAYGGAATPIAEEAMAKGAITYLTKPFDYAELDECIVMAIRAWRQESEEMANLGFLEGNPELALLQRGRLPASESRIEHRSEGMRLAKHDVFLTYNSADSTTVMELAHRLAQDGIRPWLDQWNLIPGEPWQEAIEEALDECATCAVFIGPSGTGPWQNEEMRSALDRAARTRNDYRVIPVLLPGAAEASVASFLASRTWVDFRSGLSDANAYSRLVAGILGRSPEQANVRDVQEGDR